MKKEKLNIDKKLLLTTMIAIYSFNDASTDLLVQVLKADRAMILDQLSKLTGIGILAGADGQQKTIMVKRDAAKSILAAHGVIYTEVEFNEAIYRYQQMILVQNPAAIKNPEQAIKQPSADITAVFDIEKNERYRLKTKKILKYLLIINLVLGLLTLVVATLPDVVRKFKRSLFSVKHLPVQLYATSEKTTKANSQNIHCLQQSLFEF